MTCRASVLLALLLFGVGCYDNPFGQVGPDDDDDDLPFDDDDAGTDDDDAGSDDDDASSDDDDFVDGLPTCEVLLESILPIDDGCHAVVAFETFEPNEEVEWQWSGSTVNANFDQVITSPMVINLTDDNADGAIDRNDVPDVVFYSMDDGVFAEAITRAVSGVDGTELWTQNTGNLRTYANAHLAAADVLDEYLGPEIVIVTDDDFVALLDANGDQIWRTAAGENLARGAPAIHDMNGDGNPEIIVGRVIFSSEGDILGTGTAGRGANNDRGRMTFAVDIDDDGELEVIAGNAVYDINGDAEWSNGEPDGFPGVADFDGDGDPEIVVVHNGNVRLQDHTGAIVWGPNEIAGNGRGGPPTIADYDGDGLPEIGIANSGFYTVLDTDGSELWARATQDVSSGMTGSSVFDFNGDGAAEVVYADEITLWVYQGNDGTVLLEEVNHTSRTQLEYPVITDIDGDEHAEIVLGSNDFFTEGWTGVTVLGTTVDRGGWWKARRIWNQHAFFFTHVDEDGTVPTAQEKPWLAHNSFRQNFPPDTWEGYPAADLTSEPAGPCIGPDGDDDLRFAVQVGNVGAYTTAVDVDVAVFAVTSSDEVLLGADSLEGFLEAGMLSTTVLVPWTEGQQTGEYRTKADDSGTGVGEVVECDETNNAADWP
ncbi:MAG: VCBS repeat-containing protein [Proteobacteria bacterium]|nr:VCBS repeat-containing protein [Actinomycetes bacterium]MCP4872590.1 VCBS repeat-containing protein [Pseudomonadota bacterium]